MTARGERERLPLKRANRTYKLRVGGIGVHVTMGLRPDGVVGEMFIDLAKEGAALRTAFQSWAIAVSKGVQYGIPIREAVATFKGTRVEPSGHVVCEPVPAVHGHKATSIYDAVARLVEAETHPTGVHVDFA